MTPNITVGVSVEEVLTALGLTAIPEGCDLTIEDEVEVRAEADVDDLRQDESDATLADFLDQTAVMELSAAIRRGDTADAELLLERVFGGELSVREWGQQACNSCRLRAA
jgi:hypothetical protein